MTHIASFLQKYVSSKQKIILACSGGPDSIFLLYQILETPYAKNLVVCYFDHKLRRASKKERLFIQALGEKHSFICEIEECDIKKEQKGLPSTWTEELARIKRYEFLEKIREKYDAPYILTAHHLDDRLETFFFNLARGSKLTGLINMTEKSGHILRPLLGFEKEEILAFLKKKKISFMVDASNHNTKISRNHLRINTLPQFKKINAQYKKNIANFLEYLWLAKWYIDEEIKDFLWESNYFPIDVFLEKPIFFQKEVIRYIFYVCNNQSHIGLTEGNIKEVIRFIWGKNNKTKKDIKKMKLYKDGNKLFFV